MKIIYEIFDNEMAIIIQANILLAKYTKTFHLLEEY